VRLSQVRGGWPLPDGNGPPGCHGRPPSCCHLDAAARGGGTKCAMWRAHDVARAPSRAGAAAECGRASLGWAFGS